MTSLTPMTNGQALAPILSDGHGLGREAADHRRFLAELGNALRRPIGPDLARELDAQLDTLSGIAFEIALIGRPGAGKTTLVNALAGRPGLLPARNEPRSATIRRLVFGVPGNTAGEAVFTMFDRTVWERLTQRGGRLRARMRRMELEDVRRELALQLMETRIRAERSLGEQITSLMGAEMRVPRAAPDTVARYLGGAQDATGQPCLAALTRTAEFHLPQTPFACPLALSDTPSVDETFLLREEQALDAVSTADLVLAVIDARSTDADAEVALLEHLAAEGTSYPVIFVNRMDGIAGSQDARRMIGTIEDAVARLWPGRGVPVVAGSGREAARALVVARQHSADGPDPQMRLAQSGLPALVAALNETLFWGPAMAQHDRVATTLEKLALSGAEELETAAEGVRRRASDSFAAGRPPEAMLPVVAEMETMIGRHRDLLQRRLDQSFVAIRQGMLGQIRTMVQAESLELQTRLQSSPSMHIDKVPGQEIAEKIEAAFIVEFTRARRELAEAIEELVGDLGDFVEEEGGQERPGRLGRLVSAIPPVEPLQLLAWIQVDLCHRSLIWSGHITRDRRMAEIQRQLYSRILPLTEKMIESATLALAHSLRSALEKLGDRHRALFLTENPSEVQDAKVAAVLTDAETCREIAARIADFRSFGAVYEDDD